MNVVEHRHEHKLNENNNTSATLFSFFIIQYIAQSMYLMCYCVYCLDFLPFLCDTVANEHRQHVVSLIFDLLCVAFFFLVFYFIHSRFILTCYKLVSDHHTAIHANASGSNYT